jgi:hypothetical protein
LSIDDIHTLVDVVIVNPTGVDLISRVVLSHGVIMFLAAQMKERLYYNRYPVDVFFPLAIEIFEYLH